MIHDDIYFGICTGRRGPFLPVVFYVNASFVGDSLRGQPLVVTEECSQTFAVYVNYEILEMTIQMRCPPSHNSPLALAHIR